jgi:hypothetical protein
MIDGGGIGSTVFRLQIDWGSASLELFGIGRYNAFRNGLIDRFSMFRSYMLSCCHTHHFCQIGASGEACAQKHLTSPQKFRACYHKE